jgi:hypothetical protein
MTSGVNAASFPSLKVEPKSMDFGSIEVGSSSLAQIVTITNDVDSTNVLAIFSVYLDGPNADSFIIQNDNCTGRMLDGSMSSTLELVFTPSSPESKNATLVVSSNVEPVGIELSGSGIATGNSQIIIPANNSPSINWPLLIGIVTLALVVVIPGLFLIRRKLGKQRPI